jgi:hypothetical protein
VNSLRLAQADFGGMPGVYDSLGLLLSDKELLVLKCKPCFSSTTSTIAFLITPLFAWATTACAMA